MGLSVLVPSTCGNSNADRYKTTQTHRPLEPMRHILHLLAIRNLPQLRNQQFRIPLNQPRQLPRRRRRKSRSQQASNPGVMRIVREDNVLVQTLAVVDRVAEHILAVLDSAWLQAVDVLPRLGLCEGEFVGRDAHDGAVFLVQGEDVVGEAATDLGVGSGSVEGAPEEGAWVVSERVEVEVVDCIGEDATNRLQFSYGQLRSMCYTSMASFNLQSPKSPRTNSPSLQPCCRPFTTQYSSKVANHSVRGIALTYISQSI